MSSPLLLDLKKFIKHLKKLPGLETCQMCLEPSVLGSMIVVGDHTNHLEGLETRLTCPEPCCHHLTFDTSATSLGVKTVVWGREKYKIFT